MIKCILGYCKLANWIQGVVVEDCFLDWRPATRDMLQESALGHYGSLILVIVGHYWFMIYIHNLNK